MKITTELLEANNACEDQVKLFNVAYPDGLEPTVENAICAESDGFDVLWCIRLLPSSGPGSFIEFSLRCAEQVVHLTDDPRVAECLEVVKREVENPGSQDMIAAGYTANDAAAYAAKAAADAAAWAAKAAAYSTSNATTDAAYAAAKAAAWAAYAAARYDTRAATDAAKSAANATAWSAARSAAKEDQITMIAKMLMQHNC